MKRNLFLLLLALQSAWVIGTVATQEIRLRRAATVLLETAPVDPRDLVRGDYVILNYKISRLPADVFTPVLTNTLEAGTTVYVTLVQDGEFHRAGSASLENPATESGLVLKGTVRSPPFFNFGSREKVHVDVDYGLERYYVREGTGTPTGKLTARVSVPKSGKGVIQEVYVDGRPYAQAMKDVAR